MEKLMDFYTQSSYCREKPPWSFDDTNDEIECIEIFTRHNGSSEIEFSKQTSRSFTNWVDSTRQRVHLRLILVQASPTDRTRLDVSKRNFERVLQSFNLERIYYFTYSSKLTIDIIPHQSRQGIVNGFHFSHHAAYFHSLSCSYDSAVGVMQGIYVASALPSQQLRAALESFKALATHPYCALSLRGALTAIPD